MNRDLVTFAVLKYKKLPGLHYYFFAAFFFAAFFLLFFFGGSPPLIISPPILGSPFCWNCVWSKIRQNLRRTSLELRGTVYRFSFEVSITSMGVVLL